MVHICNRHSGNMAGAEAEQRAEVEAKPERSEAPLRHLPFANYASLGAASAAARTWTRHGYTRDASSSTERTCARLLLRRRLERDADMGWGVRGALVFVPDTGIN